jgi:hypothetical protein
MAKPSQPAFVERRPRAGVLDRVFRRQHAEDVLIEINNLFAKAVRVRNVSSEDVDRILSRYGIARGGEMPGQPDRLYRDYLLHCLADRQLTDEELADLEHLRSVLRLDAGTIALVHRRVAREVYSRTVDDVLADAAIDEAEREFLRRLRDHLEIPPGIADNILDMKQRQREARGRPG